MGSRKGKKRFKAQVKTPKSYAGFFALAAICLAVIITYANSLNGPFVYDDLRAIIQNESIRIENLSPSSLSLAAFTGASARRPVAGLTLALNYYLGGYSVRGYHIVNTIIHILNGILVYFLCLVLFRRFRISEIEGDPGFLSPLNAGAVFASLVFVLHPVQTQAVSYLIQRMASLSTMFYLLSFIFYAAGRERSGRSRWIFLGASLVSWIMALGSKEIAAVLPAVVLAYEWLRGRAEEGRKTRKVVFLISVAVLAAAVPLFVFLGGDPLAKILDTYRGYDFTPGERLLTELRVVVFYMGLVALPLPSRLNLDHYFPVSKSFIDPLTTLFSLLILCAVLVFALAYRRKTPLISFCILWFFINLAIESSVIGLDLVFEHRLYLPMAGVCVGLGWCLVKALGRFRGKALIAGGIILVLLAWGTISRNAVWQDEARLWQDVVTKNPHSYWARNSLGMAYMRSGELSEAVSNFKEALKLKPDHIPTMINMSVAMAGQGNTGEAQRLLAKVLDFNPKDFEALYNLGLMLASDQRLEDAERYFQRAVEIRPWAHQANIAMGRLRLTQGRLDDAGRFAKKAVKADPRSAEGHLLLAGIYLRQGDLNKSLEEYQRAVELNPFDPSAQAAIGELLIRMGKTSEGLKHYMDALKLQPDEGLRRRIIEVLEYNKSK